MTHGNLAALSPALPTEQMLIERITDLQASTFLCTSLGRAQLAFAAAEASPGRQVHCSFLDCFRAALVPAVPATLPVTVACETDFPDGPFDIAALPLTATGEAELVRDQLQAAHLRLPIGGKLLASTDNPKDRWLGDEVKKLFGTVTRHVDKGRGVVYIAPKQQPLKKVKNFRADFAIRDRDRLIYLSSRPGVFAHRRMDVGARRLIDAMEIKAGQRVLDLGCGSGAVALAAAVRAEGVHVHAVDAAARAVQCTQWGIQSNDLTNVTTELSAHGPQAAEHVGAFDWVLANPPYYGHFRIAELFLAIAARSLAPGGHVLFVNKQPDWYAENLPNYFRSVKIGEDRGYHLAHARARKAR